MKTPRILVRSIFLTIAMAIAAAPFSARAAEAPEKKVEGTVQAIVVNNEKEFMIDGKTYPMEQLARRLKSAGAKADSEIRVQIPKDTPAATLTKLSTVLMQAGYVKFIFVKPRHAESIPGK